MSVDARLLADLQKLVTALRDDLRDCLDGGRG